MVRGNSKNLISRSFVYSFINGSLIHGFVNIRLDDQFVPVVLSFMSTIV